MKQKGKNTRTQTSLQKTLHINFFQSKSPIHFSVLFLAYADLRLHHHLAGFPDKWQAKNFKELYCSERRDSAQETQDAGWWAPRWGWGKSLSVLGECGSLSGLGARFAQIPWNNATHPKWHQFPPPVTSTASLKINIMLGLWTNTGASPNVNWQDCSLKKKTNKGLLCSFCRLLSTALTRSISMLHPVRAGWWMPTHSGTILTQSSLR